MKFSVATLQNIERAFGIAGLGILGWMIYRLGPERIAQNLHTVSWGFFLMVMFRCVRYLCQAVSWKLILGEGHKKISFWKLFRINLEGESLNYITVTRIGGEPLKVLGLVDHHTLAQSAASVIVLKFCHLFGFWIVVSLGFVALLLDTDVSGEIKRNAGIGLVMLTIFIVLSGWVQEKGMFRPFSWFLEQFRSKRQWIAHQVLRLTRLDNEILETYRSKPGRVIFSAFLNALGWAEEIFFIWLALRFLKVHENWFLPTLIGTMSLLLNILFFFVPWRAGTQEGTMVLTFTLLDLSEPMGLSVAILRRLRELIWVFAGLILFGLESVAPQHKHLAQTTTTDESHP